MSVHEVQYPGAIALPAFLVTRRHCVRLPQFHTDIYYLAIVICGAASSCICTVLLLYICVQVPWDFISGRHGRSKGRFVHIRILCRKMAKLQYRLLLYQTIGCICTCRQTPGNGNHVTRPQSKYSQVERQVDLHKHVPTNAFTVKCKNTELTVQKK